MLLIILLCLSTILTLPLYASDHLEQQILPAKGITYSAYPNCTEAGTFADRVHKVCSPCSSQCMEDDQYPFNAECCDELRKCRNNAAGKEGMPTGAIEKCSKVLSASSTVPTSTSTTRQYHKTPVGYINNTLVSEKIRPNIGADFTTEIVKSNSGTLQTNTLNFNRALLTSTAILEQFPNYQSKESQSTTVERLLRILIIMAFIALICYIIYKVWKKVTDVNKIKHSNENTSKASATTPADLFTVADRTASYVQSEAKVHLRKMDENSSLVTDDVSTTVLEINDVDNDSEDVPQNFLLNDWSGSTTQIATKLKLRPICPCGKNTSYHIAENFQEDEELLTDSNKISEFANSSRESLFSVSNNFASATELKPVCPCGENTSYRTERVHILENFQETEEELLTDNNKISELANSSRESLTSANKSFASLPQFDQRDGADDGHLSLSLRSCRTIRDDEAHFQQQPLSEDYCHHQMGNYQPMVIKTNDTTTRLKHSVAMATKQALQYLISQTQPTTITRFAACQPSSAANQQVDDRSFVVTIPFQLTVTIGNNPAQLDATMVNNPTQPTAATNTGSAQQSNESICRDRIAPLRSFPREEGVRHRY